jgi:hypothetical protein
MPKRQTRNHRRSRKQRGGMSPYEGGYGAYSYTGPAGVSAGGVPFESRAANNYNCGWTYRQPPQLGGRRSRRSRHSSKQRGGGCGCGWQKGGGGGTGGYGFVLDNSIGKVYDHLSIGACPPTPVANQLGGGPSPIEASLREIVSYPSGYGFGRDGVVSTSSAHYLDPTGYGRHCMGGGSRKHRHKKGCRHSRKTRNRNHKQ